MQDLVNKFVRDGVLLTDEANKPHVVCPGVPGHQRSSTGCEVYWPLPSSWIEPSQRTLMLKLRGRDLRCRACQVRSGTVPLMGPDVTCVMMVRYHLLRILGSWTRSLPVAALPPHPNMVTQGVSFTPGLACNLPGRWVLHQMGTCNVPLLPSLLCLLGFGRSSYAASVSNNVALLSILLCSCSLLLVPTQAQLVLTCLALCCLCLTGGTHRAAK